MGTARSCWFCEWDQLCVRVCVRAFAPMTAHRPVQAVRVSMWCHVLIPVIPLLPLQRTRGEARQCEKKHTHTHTTTNTHTHSVAMGSPRVFRCVRCVISHIHSARSPCIEHARTYGLPCVFLSFCMCVCVCQVGLAFACALGAAAAMEGFLGFCLGCWMFGLAIEVRGWTHSHPCLLAVCMTLAARF